MHPANSQPDPFSAPGTSPGGGGTPPAPWVRAAVVQGGLIVFAIALIARAAQVQLVERDEWRARARAQQLTARPLPAPRGTILDATGVVLVESRQLVKLGISPREVMADMRKRGDGSARMETVTRTLTRVGVSPEWVARVRDTTRAWVEVPGRYLATDLGPLTSMRGVHAEPALDRVPPANAGLRRLVGRADDAGGPTDGLEKALDGLLRGTGGREALVRDARGQRIRTPDVFTDPPVPGHTVVLTINSALQDIAERALSDAVATMRATGGDIVMLDPATGEVRAMASLRANRLSTGATALTEPYEPGSTLKPFVAARLLDLGRARADETMNTYGGKWELDGRKLVDDHPADVLSLADIIRYSSNIGIVQFAQRMSNTEQFEMLRDLGFGTPTGIAYPSESPGLLPAPRRWDKLTSVSMSMGYAVSVTPLQLATAYAAIANGGELLEPVIVREVRTPDGDVTWRHRRRVVRRVMSPESAKAVREMLRGVVEAGTAMSSRLSTFDVAGKTGTAKIAINGRYNSNQYTASFVGMFPADEPQLIILVKLDNPTKSIYGGRAAAPVSKVVLQAAFAARDAALDYRALADAPSRARSGIDGRSTDEVVPVQVAQAELPADATPVPGAPDGAAVTGGAAVAGGAAVTGGAADPLAVPEPAGTVAWVARVDEPRESARTIVARRAVPDVSGLPLRRAVYELHRAGFRTSLPGGGGGADRAQATSPSAGTLLTTGSIVVVEREP